MRKTPSDPRTETVRPDEPEPDVWPSPLGPGSVLEDRFEIRSRLGRGGHASVYRAYDRRLDVEVALKVLHSHRTSERGLARFRREAKTARELRHPNLLRVFDIGFDGDVVYLSMELVDGPTLAERLLANEPLATEEALEIAEQVLAALVHLHGEGLLHRDVKPSNILLDGETAKLADFGLVLALDDDATRLTRTEALIGTLDYLSPEQALGETLRPASDLYSFGVVLFEMFAGRLPHEASSSLGTLLERLRKAPPSLRDARPDLPHWLHRYVDRLLARDPRDRYQSAGHALADLKRRRSPRRIPRRHLIVGSLLALLLAAASLLAWRETQTRFGGLTFNAGTIGASAVDRAGRELWRRDDLRTVRVAPVRLAGDRTVGFVAMLSDPVTSEPRKPFELALLERSTGRVRSTIALPRIPRTTEFFSDFSDTYYSELAATDLDHDAFSEILVSHLHAPYGPTFVTLVEPRLDRRRILFWASGHHRYAGSVDLDGDGDDEVLLLGINNGMGFRTAVAALELVPPAGDPDPRQAPPARSPDLGPPSLSEQLLWYVLLPSGGACNPGVSCVTVDRESRQIVVSVQDRRSTFDFSGFSPSEPSTLPIADRQRARMHAYHAWYAAKLLRESENGDEALQQIDVAMASAARAGDSVLEEFLALEHAATLAYAGRLEAAEQRFQQLYAADASTAVCHRAGTAFLFADAPERAFQWFSRGLNERFGQTRATWRQTDLFEGATLALFEQRAWPAATSFLERWLGTSYIEEVARFYLALLHVLQPRAPGAVTWYTGYNSMDSARWIPLEMQLARDGPSDELIEAIDRELARSSYTVPLLHSLRAQALLELGRVEEAAESADRAYQTARARYRRQPLAHALFWLVQERRQGVAAANSRRAIGEAAALAQ